MPEASLDKVDFAPYFLRWNSVMFYPAPDNQEQTKKILANYSGDGGVIPCHQHKSCMNLVNATEKYPPRVCPHCGVDTDTELTSEERGFDPRGFSKSAICTP